MEIKDIMSRQLVTVALDDRVGLVRDLFLNYRFHHLLVVERKKLLGVISDRDLFKNLSPFIGRELAERSQDLALLDRRVHQIMTRKLVTVMPDTALINAVQVMVSQGVSCLPVINEQRCAVGIVSWKDLFRAMVPDVRIPPVRPQDDEAVSVEAPSDAAPLDVQITAAPAVRSSKESQIS